MTWGATLARALSSLPQTNLPTWPQAWGHFLWVDNGGSTRRNRGLRRPSVDKGRACFYGYDGYEDEAHISPSVGGGFWGTIQLNVP